jgi:hypothetical protein
VQNYEIEVVVANILRRVESGAPVEDDAHVELKREWPLNHADAARRIAAHANSARGAEVIWIIGADEKGRSVPGVVGMDPAAWFDQVAAHFESRWTPLLRTVVVPWRDVAVVTLVFDTEGSPYVVKRDGWLEVPWRGSTQTRSARRHELLQLLAPIARAPHVEPRSGRLALKLSPSDIAPFVFSIWLELYVTPSDDRMVVLPFHRMRGSFRPHRRMNAVEFDHFAADIRTGPLRAPAAPPPRAPHIDATSDEVIITGPGRFRLRASGRSESFDESWLKDDYYVDLTLGLAGQTTSMSLREYFVHTGAEDYEVQAWLRIPPHLLSRNNQPDTEGS